MSAVSQYNYDNTTQTGSKRKANILFRDKANVLLASFLIEVFPICNCILITLLSSQLPLVTYFIKVILVHNALCICIQLFQNETKCTENTSKIRSGTSNPQQMLTLMVVELYNGVSMLACATVCSLPNKLKDKSEF